MGGTLLRERSLSDAQVIALVQRHFIPVWVNVTEQPVPDVPALAEWRRAGEALHRHPVAFWFFRTFQNSTVVLSPDGRQCLQPVRWRDSDEPAAYRAMLKAALQRYRKVIAQRR